MHDVQRQHATQTQITAKQQTIKRITPNVSTTVFFVFSFQNISSLEIGLSVRDGDGIGDASGNDSVNADSEAVEKKKLEVLDYTSNAIFKIF